MSMDDLDEINVAELDAALSDGRLEDGRYGPFEKEGLCNTDIGKEEGVVYCWEDPEPDIGRCKLHKVVDDHGAPPGALAHNANNVQHWLKTSAMTFLKNVDEQYKEMYSTFLMSLVHQYEEAHGTRPKPHHLGQLDEVAFNMVKLRLSREYEKEQAVDPTIPLTETKIEDIGGEPMEVEVLNKVNKMKKDIRRENRLALKDMQIGPEKTAADDEEEEEAEDVISWQEDLQEGTE